MNTAETLLTVFNNNFVAYYRSHMAHVNIVGRNFTSDHELLGKVYEDLQSQIDTLGELLRTLREMMPSDIQTVLADSTIYTGEFEGDSITLLSGVLDDLETLKAFYEELIEIAEAEGYKEIANYAQDRVLALAKFIWMFESTLD